MAVNRQNFALPDFTMRSFIYRRDRLNGSVPNNGHLYFLRAYDSGTAGYVYWGPYSSPGANLTPTSAETTPNYTGSLSAVHVWLVK